MLRYFAFLIILYISIGASAQNKLTGKVEDADSNRPLAGATVQVQGSIKFAVTDAFGVFTINGLTESTVTLLVKYLGYEDKVTEVSVQGTDILIQLSESVTITDEVVINATRCLQSRLAGSPLQRSQRLKV